MSIALYRKYRPKTFAEVTGQNHIKITLQNEIEANRVVHAYLFCGPRGTGKTTMARLLAKAVNCLDRQPSGEPCNHCASCEDIMANKALDIIEIDAASHTGVDNVRENIIQNARFTPTRSKFKVFIIDEVHMLSISAFNAMLKILEESPKYVIFILATTEAHKVPSTIISRCQRFDFKKINFPELTARLKWIVGEEGIVVEDRVLSLIAKQAGGCVRDAESLLEQILSLGEKNITLEQAELILPRADFDLLYRLLEFVVRKQTAEAIELVNRLVMDGIDISLFTNSFIEFVRRILLYKINGKLDELSREIEDSVVQQILQLLPEVSSERLVAIIIKCLNCKESFKQSYLVQLPLEIAVFELTAARAGSATPAPAASRIEPGEKKPDAPMAPPAPASFVAAKSVAEEENSSRADAEEETAKVPTGPAANFGEICSRWDQVLERVKCLNYSLYMSLRMGKPIRFDSNILYLGFLFELQKQRIESMENRRIVSEILQELFGEKVRVETSLEPSLTLADFSNHKSSGFSAPASLEDSVKDVASEFGGEVVDEI